jgi:pyrroline-5-carboxylate reductase
MPAMKTRKKIAVLGAGKIGQTLVAGILEAGVARTADVMVVTKHRQTLDAVTKRFRVRGTLSCAEATGFADVVLVCVKPQTIREVLGEIDAVVTPRKLLITTVASVPTTFVESTLGEGIPVIRTMPNTPCLIRKGMVAIAPGRHVKKSDLAIAEQILGALGRTVVLDEKHMNAVTGLSGSGPAFMYVMVEALAEGGVKVGLPRDVATLLAAQTMMGAGSMVLETGEHPSLLKDAVTTPAGCTIDGILELEDGGLRVTLIKAVVKATQRAGELFSPSPGEAR